MTLELIQLSKKMNLALLQIRDIWQDILDVNKPTYVVPITHNPIDNRTNSTVWLR